MPRRDECRLFNSCAASSAGLVSSGNEAEETDGIATGRARSSFNRGMSAALSATGAAAAVDRSGGNGLLSDPEGWGIICGYTIGVQRMSNLSGESSTRPAEPTVSALPGGTVTFLFSDIEGSTRLLERLGDRYSDVHRDHRRILREELARAAGREVDTQGDALFFSFARAKEAARGAVAAQRALAAHEWPDGVDVKVRMGLHTGEPIVDEEGYLGMDVVRAARICSAGHGGQILLSEATRVLLGSDLPDGVEVRDLGNAQLKDVKHERIFQLQLTDATDGFPPLKTAAPETEADQLAKQIESRVHEQILAAFDRGTPAAPTKLLRMTLIGGLVVLVLVVAAAIAIFLLMLALS